MWRHLLYAASIAEAALLAAALVAVVIQPDVLGLAPSSGVRQFCGWGAVALMVGCGYALVAWLRSLLTRARARALLVAVPAIVVVASACGSLPSVPNPFAPSATPRPTIAVPAQVTPTPRPAPTPVPEAAPEPFAPFWVRNHRITELWSGASGGPDTVSFGATSGQFCSFLVVLPPEGDRLYVLNPYSQDYLWLDAADVGPAGPPVERPDPRPPDVNCTQDIYAE